MINNLFLSDIILWDITLAQCSFYSSSIVFITTLLLTLRLAYSYCRPLLPARANCWFCNRNQWVPFNERNCFDCRHCDQYNGFTKDGDYNKEIAEQGIVKNRITTSHATEKSNGFCRTCNVNQELKIQQLASFAPINEDNFDEEINDFKEQLDRACRLCHDCNLLLTQTLQTQYYDILTQRLNGHCPQGTASASLVTPRDKIASILKTISFLLLAVVSFISILDFSMQFSSGNSLGVPLWILSILGNVTYGASTLFRKELSMQEKLILFLWTNNVVVSWTMQIEMVIFTSCTGLGCYFFPKGKKLKTGVMTYPTPPPPDVASIDKPVNEGIKESIDKKEEKIKEDAKPVEKPVVHEIVAAAVPIVTPVTPSRMVTRSQTAQTLEPEEPQKIDRKRRLFSPPPEMYLGMNNLRLGSPEPKPRPAKNIESVFPKVKPKISLIMPAKLSFGRKKSISTPKIQEVTPLKRISVTPTQVEPLPELNISALSPISSFAKQYSPPKTYPDIHYPCNVGFGPMGQTTIFTYGRPDGQPYGFPRFPPYGVPMDYPRSPAPSEVFSHSSSHNASSVCGEVSEQWSWLKKFFYVSSACLNLITLIFLSYSFWKG